MKTITKFQAYDGREFTDSTECAAYEANSAVADTAIALFPPIPELPGCGFQNGDGYIQHDRDTFLAVRRTLLEQANKEFPHKWFTQSIADETAHPSAAARIIGECCTDALNKAWYRIYCTDPQFREWGQPYYASHPEAAKQVCLNPPALTSPQVEAHI